MAKSAKHPIPSPEEPEAIEAASAGRKREAAIRTNVLSTLGRPARLLKVAIMPLWDNNYRVNVVIGDDASTVNIPNSYFVTADDLGNILGSTPRILKQY